MNHYALILSSLIAFIAGIAAHQCGLLELIDLFSFFSLLSVLGVLLLMASKGKLSQLLLQVFLILLCLQFGISRSLHTTHIPSPNTVDFYASEDSNSITLTGTIVEEPDIRRDKINYTIESQGSGLTLISASKYPSYHYGDIITVTGHLQQPTSFEDFDYAGYLSRYGIYSVMYRPRIELHAQADTGSLGIWRLFYQQLLRIKTRFEYQMNRTFSTEPSSSFMAGLLLGSRKGIPEELSEAFRITGLTHIIAISGYNITLIVTILMSLFRPLGKRAAISISALGVVLFTLFVGASPAVVRACIMGLIGLLALNSQRKGDITLTLLLTACIMLGYNPKILIFDVGFQLSFLATMGLIYVSPLIEPFFRWLPQQLAIRESILLTLSAQIMALPIIVFNFHNLSVVSPLSNLLIAGPIIPLAMLFGFLGTLVSFLSLSLAKLIAYPAYLLLQYITSITSLTAQIPYASVSISWFSESLFVLYFIVLSLFLTVSWHKHQQRTQRIRILTLQFQQLIHYHSYAYALHS